LPEATGKFRNSSVTKSFSSRRDGTLVGPPKPTAMIKVNGDAKAYFDAATSALRHRLALSLSPALAQGIAGNVFTLQFNSPKKWRRLGDRLQTNQRLRADE
jgi:hypothetical protein